MAGGLPQGRVFEEEAWDDAVVRGLLSSLKHAAEQPENQAASNFITKFSKLGDFT